MKLKSLQNKILGEPLGSRSLCGMGALLGAGWGYWQPGGNVDGRSREGSGSRKGLKVSYCPPSVVLGYNHCLPLPIRDQHHGHAMCVSQAQKQKAPVRRKVKWS